MGVLKQRIEKLEQKTEENYFADTVKVNFSNSKPIRKSSTDKQNKKEFN